MNKVNNKSGNDLPTTPWIMFGAVKNTIVDYLLSPPPSRIMNIPEFIVDNSVKLVDKTLNLCGENIDIKKPDKNLLNYATTHSIIIVTFSHWEEMEKQLAEIGFPRKKIFVAIRDFDLFHTFEFHAFNHNVDLSNPMPQILCLELSGRCNCKCVFCSQQKKTEKGFMQWETLENIVTKVKDIKSLNMLDLTGSGEIFLNKEWFDMAQYALQSTGIKHLMMYTNGMLLTQENAIKIGKLNAELIEFHISTDGDSPKENDRYRIGSKYDTVKRNLLQAHDILKDDNRIEFTVNNGRPMTQEKLLKEKYTVKSRSVGNPPTHLLRDFPFAKMWCGRINYYGSKIPDFLDVATVKWTDENFNFCLNLFQRLEFDFMGDLVRCRHNPGPREIISNIVHDNDPLKSWQEDHVLVGMRKNYISHILGNDFCRGCGERGMGEFCVSVKK